MTQGIALSRNRLRNIGRIRRLNKYGLVVTGHNKRLSTNRPLLPRHKLIQLQPEKCISMYEAFVFVTPGYLEPAIYFL